MSSETAYNFERIASFYQKHIPTKQNIIENFPKQPIYKVNNKFCISTVAKVNSNFKIENLNNEAFIGSRIGNIVTIKVPVTNVNDILNFNNVLFLSIAERIKPLNNKMTADLRVDSVWEGINMPQGFTGKNVLIGITDWGFDYDHPMFMDTTLTTSRVRAAWDHFKVEGNQPSMGYGVEYVTPSELDNANSDTASTYYEYATHGSHVAGIAGGSGAGLQYRGVAFEAQYLFNSVQLDVGSVIDAFTWMKNIADNDNKRLVINMSWGLYYLGTMDGTSLISQAINNLSNQGVVFVTSAGNNGSVDLHLKKEFNNDSISSRIGFYSYSAHAFMWGQSISMWGEPNKPFSAQLEIYDVSNSLLGVTNVYNTQIDNGYHDSILVLGIDTIFYNYTVDEVHPQNQRPHIRLRVKNTNTSYRVVLNSFAPTGTVHYWNVVELSNGVGNWGMPFYSFGTNGVSGDTHYSLGEPSCSESAITVAAHRSESVSNSGTAYPGPIASFSSEGPTYDERIKPDVSAPGVNVISSINSYTTRSYTSVANTVFNGRTYDFAAFSGTSMSSPATAGVVALMLEANPLLSPSDVRNILKLTARQDNRTGTIIMPGSVEWGMGKVTATDAIQMALTTVSIGEEIASNILTLFPNPVQNELTLRLNEPLENKIKFEIYSIDGKLVAFDMLSNTKVINVSNWQSGIYFVKIKTSKKQSVLKFIKD
jgi:subtilisin family serine protease